MGKPRKFLAVAVCAAAVGGLSAGSAFAGEITGPPGTPGVAGSATGKPTAGPTHANSACVFSGLNDMNPDQGQIDRITQTPKDGPAGAPGHGAGEEFPIGCRGGSNPERGGDG